MKIKIIFLIFFYCSVFNFLFSYTITDQKLINKYKRAYEFYRKKRFKHSYKIVNDILDENSNFIEAKLLLAKLFQKLSSLDNVLNILNEISSLVIKDEYINYDISYLYYRVGKYYNAKTILSRIDKKKISIDLKNKFIKLRKNIKFSIEAKKKPFKFEPKAFPAPLNKFSAQYFPVMSIDNKKIYFTGRDSHDITATENIYISKKIKGKWTKPVLLSSNINTKSNEGACTISSDGNLIIFSAYNRRENIGSCDLYYSEKKGKVWTMPKNLGTNINSTGWQSQPSLSADGKYLYFASKRKGNVGKKDIWVSIKNSKGKWGKAINLGKKINTKGIEISPFIHPNGTTLFFASDRSPSLGGLDLYYSENINGKWSNPKNLGFPINDHLDQVSLFITADGRTGCYAAGSQKGVHYNGKLYSFLMPQELVPYPRCTFVKGNILVHEQDTPEANIEIIDFRTKTIEAKIKVTENGNFCIPLKEGKDYRIKIIKKGYISKTVSVNLIERKNLKPIILNPKLNKVYKNIPIIFQNIFFEFNKHHMNNEGIEEIKNLAEFLKENSHLKVIIQGYTDDIGSIKYNQKLSVLRAKEVYLELLKHNILPYRIKYLGFGILINNNKKKLNRKVSFKIVDEFKD